jgi:hypothetical protein
MRMRPQSSDVGIARAVQFAGVRGRSSSRGSLLRHSRSVRREAQAVGRFRVRSADITDDKLERRRASRGRSG